MVEVTAYSDTTTDGLSELTTRQNPNLKNYDLFYDSKTMLRENEFSDSLINQRRCNIHIYTLVLGQKKETNYSLIRRLKREGK